VLSIEETERNHWDCLVIGTGVGGATLGSALAKAGKKVLFLEKGRAPFLHADTLRGTYPELRFPRVEAASARDARLLARAGRCYEEVRDGDRSFVPFIGCGTGGSSALYGMAMERLFPADFEPRQHFANASGSTLPEAWPVRYEHMVPYYQQAEELYRVRGSRDYLRPDASGLLPPPPLSPRNAELYSHFQAQGLHPYHLPLACESFPGCECCQGYLCPRDCKNDAGRICLEPAVRNHGAMLLDECEVLRLEASQDRVTGVVCRWQGQTVVQHADHIVLAAGALMTPALLLRSTSAHWPQGLANGSGLVGRNLMHHCVDLYLIYTREGGENRLKELGLSDFYLGEGGKLGTVQSFGLLPPGSILAATVAKNVHDAAPWASPLFGLVQPLLSGALSRLFSHGVLLAAIMEDLPYADNRVVPGPPLGIDYHLHPQDLARAQVFRTHLAKILKPYRYFNLRQAKKNSMLAHVCGTCRFGEDPAISVLDPYNRAHAVTNLHIVDSSFFPSSGGTNPALTIAANALRVADHLLARDPQAQRYP
jgi:choline dehydrogenase-like flavoprotein